MIRCIIVEDEELAQDVIRTHLQQFSQFELAGVYRNAKDAMPALTNDDIDVMFLDIQLPGMTGIHFLRTLRNPPLVVLTTAYPEYALESYEFNVIDYLLKPISFERFSRAIHKIAEGRLYSSVSREQKPAPDHFFVRSNSKYFRVNFNEILYIEGMKDYLKIHADEFSLITHQTMNEMEKLLPSSQFIRIHKSFIVSLSRIRSIYGNSVELKNKTIPVGSNYKDAVMSVIAKK